MSTTVEKLLADALQLAKPDRARLASLLMDSLEAESDAEIEAAWSAEIGRRVDDLERGTVKPVPWAEARRMILAESAEPSD